MQEEVVRRSSVKKITKTVLALKAARLSLGLNRRQAAERCACSIRAIEQLENGRCNFSEERIRRIVEKMGMSWAEFNLLIRRSLRQMASQKDIDIDLAIKNLMELKAIGQKRQANTIQFIFHMLRLLFQLHHGVKRVENNFCK